MVLKNKSLVLIIAILVSFLLSGCTGGSNTTVNYGDPFVGGDSGASLEFIAGAPPEAVFDNGQYPFSVGVKLENEGEYDIGEGFLEIQGISAREFGLSDSDLKISVPEIRGAKKNSDGSVMTGGSEVVTFDNLKFQEDLAGNLNLENFRVRACYDYETKSSGSICIKKENVDGLMDDEICKVNGDKDIVNSGAPIKILKLSETSRGKNGIQIAFDVGPVNLASGKWFPKGDSECDEKISNSKLYKLGVEVDPIVNGKFRAKCTGGSFNGGNSGEIILYNGQPQKVICSFDTGESNSDFETRVNIKLKYRYSQYIEKSLLIKDLGTE